MGWRRGRSADAATGISPRRKRTTSRWSTFEWAKIGKNELQRPDVEVDFAVVVVVVVGPWVADATNPSRNDLPSDSNQPTQNL